MQGDPPCIVPCKQGIANKGFNMKVEYENFSAELFQGFYDSALYNSDSLSYMSEEEFNIFYDFRENGFEEFEQEVARQCVQLLWDNLDDDKGFIKSLEYKGLYSPRYYNFETDKLDMIVDCDTESLIEYVKTTARGDFDKYLQQNWKCRDGFVSFVPDNVGKFFVELEDDFNKLIQVIIEYYLLKHVNLDSYFEDCCDMAREVIIEYTEPKQILEVKDNEVGGYSIYDNTCYDYVKGDDDFILKFDTKEQAEEYIEQRLS